MRKYILTILLVLFLAAVPLLKPQYNVAASVVSAGDLIAWMNGLRVANGYSAMVRDSLLDSSAASAAYAMYANGGCGHPGGKMERIAATGYGGGATFFATENIACAVSADLSWFANYNVWGDPIHQLPATDAQYTHVGAFAYTAPNGTTYYVMHAASDPYGSTSGSSSSSANTAVPTAQLIEPVFTVTPQEDGSVVHTVKYGQTLYTIAVWYGVTIDQIKTLNGLTSNAIYEGQKLIIRQAPSATVTPTVTVTISRPTRTPTATSAPRTAAPTATLTPTPQPGLFDSLPKIDRQWLGLGLLVFSAAGFFAILVISFLKPMRKK